MLPWSSDLELYVSADIADHGPTGVAYQPNTAIIGSIDWTTREMTVLASFDDPEGTSSLTLALSAPIPNLPPAADAGPGQIVECGGPGGTEVTIDGSASSDPDGSADIEGFTWSARSVEAGASTVSRPGATWTTVVPEGATVFTLNVSDAHGGADSDAMRVTVDDSSGPASGEIELATDCLWPPNHSMALFELGADLVAPATDVCDAAPTVRIASVTSNQPEDGSGDGHTAPDVVFGEGAFCVRAERAGTSREPREYTVVLEAANHAGNVTETEVAIRVHHDRRDGQRCEIPDSVELVGDDDPRCTASIPPRRRKAPLHPTPRCRTRHRPTNPRLPRALSAGPAGRPRPASASSWRRRLPLRIVHVDAAGLPGRCPS